MAVKRKNPNAIILNQTDLSILRLVRFHPCAIADMTDILHLTSQQVRASLEKLVQRNEVFPILVKTDRGRHNIYFPNGATAPETIKQNRLQAIRLMQKGLGDPALSLEDKVRLLVEVDKALYIVYTGMAGHANMRKDAQ